MWEAYRRDHGPNGDQLILVAQGASRDFNPSLPQTVVDRALERDHAAASAEYLAIFRSDIENFVNREAVELALLVVCASVRRYPARATRRLSIQAVAAPTP